ncbi:threonine ammonia-lyase [Tistrella sp. BH-R2-4]|uniref:Threonine ammonia-lyase n=1 Tax=Tistrella arctica TaxID=3133430 RepID=A0ABU9YF34_9PROT
MPASTLLPLDMIREAAGRLDGSVERTPCKPSRTLSLLTGARVICKYENLQFTASFKERGALNRMLALDDDARARGVIAMSAGNHAQGVALQARKLGIPATIVMPRFTPFTKVAHTRALGARVVLEGDTLEEARARADTLAAEAGYTFIHPYDDPLIAAGQGTVALEMLEQAPEIEVLLVPVGGGGLIAGCAAAAKALKPGIEVIGIQADRYPFMAQALGREVHAAQGMTIAEGIAVKSPGQFTRAVIAEMVDDMILVSEEAIEHAVQLFVEIEKTVVEGAGAVGLAALLDPAHRARFKDRTVGIVVSGGNIDTRILSSILLRGLVRDGKVMRLRVISYDRPGELALVARLVGDAGANILEVYHQRAFSHVPIKAVEIDLVVETRGPEHAAELIVALEKEGLEVQRLDHDISQSGSLQM